MLQTIIMPPQWVWISFPLVCATDSAVLYATSIYILFLFLRWSPVTMEWNTSEGNVANGMHRQKFPKKIGIRDTRSIKVPQPFLVSTRRKLSLQILGGWGTTSRGAAGTTNTKDYLRSHSGLLKHYAPIRGSTLARRRWRLELHAPPDMHLRKHSMASRSEISG